jgi:DNA-binding NarL/FixJ family response regulator
MAQIRILLADDHNILRDGMRLLLERQPGFLVVGEAADGRETLQLTEDQSPDVVIMDIAMPNMNGIEATRRIVEKHPKTGVVILSMHHDESYVIRSLKAGARAYLLKDALKTELIAAIHAVVEGRSFFSP